MVHPVSAKSPELNERSQYLLKVLVERYIRDGQPVGSRLLSRDSGLELSPATIRNVMADLEEMGLVRSPHTSAGRVPTVQGYRVFVDTLLTVKPLSVAEVRGLSKQLDPEQTSEALTEATSSMLAELTHLAGLVTMPRQEYVTLRQIEFLPLSDTRVLVVLVVNEREVQNRVISTTRRFTASELQQASNYLTRALAGKDLRAVREQILCEMQAARESMNQMMVAAINMAGLTFAEECKRENFVVTGQTNLMEYDELGDMEKLRNLFEAFGRKCDILHLLDQSLTGQGVQLFIGEESGYQALDVCSVVTAPYQVEGNVVGVLAVIGPTRMAYERVIPLVDITAKLLGAALNPKH
jgi:heat-inducible transcriptional repressor